MKSSILLRLSSWFAVVAALSTYSVALGGSGEYIVNSQIVSDSATGGSTFVGDSYVGDMSADESGAYDGVGCIERQYGQPDLFYNYFTQGNCNRANAQMYLSPHPIPPHVGHTFYTYQPLYPHHYMFRHRDRYHNYYDFGRGTNRTRVSYRPSAYQLIENVYWNFIRLPR